MTKEERDKILKSLRMGKALVDLYQQSLDVLDLEVDFNLKWPNGEEANARDLFNTHADESIKILEESEITSEDGSE